MRLTLEPNKRPPEYRGSWHATVVIEIDTDDVSMEELAGMFRRAALAYGFHADNVNEYLPSE